MVFGYFLFILLLSPLALAQDNPFCPIASDAELEQLRDFKFPETATLGANIAPLKKTVRSDNRKQMPEYYMNSVAAIKVNANEGSLSEGMTSVGQNNCQFGIFLDGKPETFLEPGDILVNFNPKVGDSSADLYENINNGMLHAAIVVKDPSRAGQLMHIDAPIRMSGTNFHKNGSFHILRLKPLPSEIQNKEELNTWLTDPQLRKKLRSFISNRNCKIFYSTWSALSLYWRGYGYNIGQAVTKDQLEEGMKYSGAPLNLHCSQLVNDVYGLHSITTNAGRSTNQTLDAIDMYLEESSKREGITRDEAARNATMELPNQINGKGSVGLRAFVSRFITKNFLYNDALARTHSFLALTGQKLKDEFAEMDESSLLRRVLDARTVSPSDLVSSVYDKNSPIAYAGTYLINPPPPLPRNGQNQTQAQGDRSFQCSKNN